LQGCQHVQSHSSTYRHCCCLPSTLQLCLTLLLLLLLLLLS
jgi:hypothetical protein